MPGMDRCTMPAPVRMAACATRRGAPVIVSLPAITRTALCHLCAYSSRSGHHSTTSTPCTRLARAHPISSPMSTNSSSPARALPGGISRPGFNAPNVTVCDAARTSPVMSPVSASTPLGTSTANTGTSPTSGGVHLPWKPVPYAASMTRSAWRQDRGSRGDVENANAHAFDREVARCDAAIGSVVSLAAQHVDRAAIRTTHHAQRRPCDR